MSEDGSDFPPHGLGSVHSRMRLLGFSLPAVFIVSLRRSQSVLRPTSKTVVRCQPWFYLRLMAYRFSGYPRGPRVGCETGCPRHAAPNFTVETHSRTRVSPEPTDHHGRKIPGNGADSGNTQAVCGFRCWASNETPFFQTSKVIAAILRASVRRAISGLIPLATRAA